MATRAQLRARALFAKRSKSGAFRKKKAKSSRKRVTKPIKRRSTSTRLMARRRRVTRRRATVTRGIRRTKKGLGSIFKSGIVGKVVMGVGAAAVTGLVIDRVAPQFSGPAKIGAGFLAAGPVGGISALVLNGGLSLLGLGGGATSGGQSV